MRSSDQRRPGWWKWMLAGLGVLAVVAILWLRRGAESQLAALRAQGHPVSLQDLEQRLSPEVVQGRQNALKLVQSVESLRRNANRSVPPRSRSASASDRAWAQQQLGGENSSGWIQIHEHLRAGPRCSADYTLGPFNPNIAVLAGARETAVAFQTEAVASAILGDTARAGQALTDAVKVGRTIESGGVLIDYLVRVACDVFAMQAAESVFSLVQLDDATLVALQSGFQVAEGTNELARALIGERALGVTAFSQITPSRMVLASNAASGLPLATAPPPSTGQDLMFEIYRTFLLGPDQRYYLSQMARLIRATETPVPEGLKRVSELEAALRQDWFPSSRMYSRITLPDAFKAMAKNARHLAVMRCAQTACAVERYQLKHQKLPPTLDALVPEFLDPIPEDPMTGEPLKYLIRGEGYVVYGVGEDGTDDRGQEWQKKPAGWDYTFVVE